MILRCIFLCLYVSLTTSQYQMDTGMRADVVFNNDNDRFDVGNIILEQNRQFRDQPAPMDYEDARRQMPLVEALRQDRRRYQESRKQRRRSLGGSDEDFVRAYHPRMIDNAGELDQYNTNLDNFRRQKPPEEFSRRNNNFQAPDGAETKGKPQTNKKLQSVKNTKPKRRRRSNKKISKETNDKAEINYNILPKTEHQSAKVISYIDTKGRRNNKKATVTNTKAKSKTFNKDPQGVILKYLHGGKNLKEGRRMSDDKTDVKNLPSYEYAVPLKMTVRGYVEIPNT